MYIPIRAHFKLSLGMGLGYRTYAAWSQLLVQVRKASPKASDCGMSDNQAPAFRLYTPITELAMPESVAVTASDPICKSLTT